MCQVVRIGQETAAIKCMLYGLYGVFAIQLGNSTHIQARKHTHTHTLETYMKYVLYDVVRVCTIVTFEFEIAVVHIFIITL